MGKSLKIKVAAAATAALAVLGGTASSQVTSNSLAPAGGLVQTMSMSDVITILSGFSISAEAAPEETEEPTLVATTSGGAIFLVSLFDCADRASATECAGAAVYTASSNAGFSYDDLNDFNTNANVTRVVNLAESNIILFGFQRYFKGGVSREYVGLTMLRFLQDMQDFMDGRVSEQTQVSLNTDDAAQDRSKVDSEVAAGLSAAEAPASQARFYYSTRAALSAAINNTRSVSFAVDD